METPLRIVLSGHVDHGKSTLIGRLLHELGELPEGKLDAVKAQSERRGMPFEWAFVLDALQAERDQGITIDTAQVGLRHAGRRYTLIDAPGHREFLRNMITGAAQADAALLLVDAREGVQEQTRRHALMLSLLGITRAVVAVNKMDRVAFAEGAFAAAERACRDYLATIGVEALAVIPVAAREGDNLLHRSARMAWYNGPVLMEALAQVAPTLAAADCPLRLPVQDVYKFDERRIIAGRIESGALAVGDEVLVSPANVTSTVASIERWPDAQRREARAGECVGITLTDPLFVERGQVISHVARPPGLTNLFRARMFWLDDVPLAPEARFRIRIAHRETLAEVRRIERVIDVQTLAAREAGQLEKLAVGDVVFRTRTLMAVDESRHCPALARMVVLHRHRIVGGGLLDLEGFADLRVGQEPAKSQHITPRAQGVSAEQRALANGHGGGILWFTGLSGAGKSTLAQALQKALFAKGYQVFVLDGDNVRKGLNRDLGFAPDERRENLRRAGEVAALFAQAGFIVITAFISPVEEDRAIARAAAPDHYHSIYIRADLATCETRDVKGLYRQARAGEIAEFTGISAPYEPPANPDLTVDTMRHDVHACVVQLVRYVERQFVEPVREAEGLADGMDADGFMASGI